MPELAREIRILLIGVWRWLKRLMYQHARGITFFTALVALSLVIYREYRESRTARIDFYGATRGSLAIGQADRIAQRLNTMKTYGGIGRVYSVEPIYTDGFLDNHRRISADRIGCTVGFSIDGLTHAPSDAVSLLLPLEANYLHFVCRNDFLDSCWRLNEIVAASPDVSSEIATGDFLDLLCRARPTSPAQGIEACVLISPRPRDRNFRLSEIVAAMKSTEGLLRALGFRKILLNKRLDSPSGNRRRIDPPKPDALPSVTGLLERELAVGRLASAFQPSQVGPKLIVAPAETNAATEGARRAKPVPIDTGPTLEETQTELTKLQELEVNLKRIRDARFYHGLTYSATRVFAKELWRHMQVDPEAVVATGILGFPEMRVAIRDGRIQGGFLVARLNSATIGAIAKDRQSALVEIDIAEGIEASGARLQAGEIPANTYHRSNQAFCPQPVGTLYARRVLIASSRLPEEDGFKIARAAANEIGIDPRSIQREAATSPSRADRPMYRLHPGADQLIRGEAQSRWLFWRHPLVRTLGPAVLLGLLAEMVASLSRRVRGGPGDPSDEPNKKSAPKQATAKKKRAS